MADPPPGAAPAGGPPRPEKFCFAGLRTVFRKPSWNTMPPPPPPHEDVVHSEPFLRSLMRRQLSLSIACAVTFLVVLLGLPLLNYFAADLMATRVAGFTLSWLVLGVLFFPFIWIISWVFIRRSIALEEDEVKSVKR
jgi:uncharacterized membrane protein (DUF485 family)